MTPNKSLAVARYLTVNVMTLGCHRCKTQAGEACQPLDERSEQIHLERI